ncbi:hypothetical protein WJX74_009186 [Apatococcus lobatus]|uniref:Secreted protein n=1 Tax=Apatococcus lobatus TaxID=904363 RepID=A0AAW1RB75_9CHLO
MDAAEPQSKRKLWILARSSKHLFLSLASCPSAAPGNQGKLQVRWLPPVASARCHILEHRWRHAMCPFLGGFGTPSRIHSPRSAVRRTGASPLVKSFKCMSTRAT